MTSSESPEQPRPADGPLGVVRDAAPLQQHSAPLAEMAQSAKQLTALARTGGFAVDEDTGNRMIQALQATLDLLESRWAELTKLQQIPPLSESPTARWASYHMVNTATDNDGLLTQLAAARREIPNYMEAIRLAKRAYQEQEDTNRRQLRELRVLVPRSTAGEE